MKDTLKKIIPNTIIELLLDFKVKIALIKKKFQKENNSTETLDYWENPHDGKNNPKNYVVSKPAHERSINLVKIIKNRFTENANILEIGCNAGRNLNYIYEAGYKNLTGIEINKNALKQFNNTWGGVYNNITIINKSIEDSILEISDEEYELVCTMAVLQHIHPNSNWIFDEMVRITRGALITMEVENFPSPRHFPRNYKKIFENRGMKQIDRIFGARIFKKV